MHSPYISTFEVVIRFELLPGDQFFLSIGSRSLNVICKDVSVFNSGQVILHCLERKSSCRKYDESNIISHDTVNGVFTIKGSSSKLHTINFGTTNGEPSCTCLDWIQWKLPCKHFLLCLSFLISGDGTAYLNNTSVNPTFSGWYK